MDTRKRTVLAVLLGAVIALQILLSAQHLGRFMTADEHYWLYERIPQYWQAWKYSDWKQTLINDKPGITLALVTWPGYALHAGDDPICSRSPEKVYTCDVNRIEGFLLSHRIPLIVVNTLLTILLFWLLMKITNPQVALWSTFFIALSPRLLGISQTVNPDALLWSTGVVSVVSFFAFLRNQEKKYALLAGVFLGFALLSKYTTSILIPFFLLASVIAAVFPKSTPAQGESESSSLNRDVLGGLAILYIAATAVMLVFLPATWVKPLAMVKILSGGSEYPIVLATLIPMLALLADAYLLRGKVFSFLTRLLRKFARAIPSMPLLPTVVLTLFLVVIAGRALWPDWTLFETVPFDQKDLTAGQSTQSPIESLLLETNPLVYSLPFATLVLILFQLLRLIRMWRKEIEWRLEICLLYVLILLHLIGFLTMDVLATPRYLILLFPIAAILAGIEAYLLHARLSGSIHPLRSKLLPFVFVVAIFTSSLVGIASVFPFYSNYTNTFLSRDNIISDTWGYGGYEAAQFLNSLPDAQNLLVWSDYEGVCEFFKGECITKQYKHAEGKEIDYAIITRRGGILYDPDHSHWAKDGHLFMKPAYDSNDPDWSLSIGGREKSFVKVVKMDNEFRSAIITDIDHCPTRRPASMENLNRFKSFASEKSVDFVISLGDNASHRLSDCSETGDMDARFIADTLRSFGKPTHFVLGDHDIASSVDSYTAWLETSGRSQTFYSFDVKNVHVLVLDTVLGGRPMDESCSSDTQCRQLEQRLSDLKKLSYAQYRTMYPDSLAAKYSERASITKLLEEWKRVISQTRSYGVRDRGWISLEQLAWIKEDIETSPHHRIVVFSDHPLFPFTSERKSYDIVNGDLARKILEESGKQIVAISGEAHLWHEETLNGIRYFIVDEFKNANGSWAFFSWNKTGARFEKVLSAPLP